MNKLGPFLVGVALVIVPLSIGIFIGILIGKYLESRG